MKKKQRNTSILILIGIFVIEAIGLRLIIPKTETWVVEGYHYEIYVRIERENSKIPVYARKLGNNKNAQLPEYKLHEGEKITKKTEKYTVICKKGEQTREFSFDYNEWNSLEIGDKIKVKKAVGEKEQIVIKKR